VCERERERVREGVGVCVCVCVCVGERVSGRVGGGGQGRERVSAPPRPALCVRGGVMLCLCVL
jgi:hypothetical protein